MPTRIDYSKLKLLISDARISSYARVFTNHSEMELHGVYLWNMVLCGALYPLIQSVEVSLRNTINLAAKTKYGEYWHNALPFTNSGEASLENRRNLQHQMLQAEKLTRSAENKARRARGQAILSPTEKPCFDDVIASTNFVVWQYVLHKSHYKLDRNYLWPKNSRRAFKNWPIQSSKDTHTILYDLVSEIRPYRNRLSHNEPLWKGTDVNNERSALEFINQKINKIEELLIIISDEKSKFLQIPRLIDKARALATKEALDSYRYRAKQQQLSLRHKKKVRTFLNDAYNNDKPTVFRYADMTLAIEKFC
jgi:hypothetical protein